MDFKGQSISTLGKVSIEILPGKSHITWVLAVLLFSAEFQMEPFAPNAILYDTRPTFFLFIYYTDYWSVQL